MKLVEIGGHQLIVMKNMHRETAWKYGYSHLRDETSLILMIKEGILAQVGGEFGIGGLFDCAYYEENDASPHSQYNSGHGTDYIQQNIYENWENYIAPSLETVVASLEHKVPILHASILAKAPEYIIKDIIDRFDCILAKDSLNRYPINVAVVEVNSGEDNEIAMKQIMNIILEATAAAQHRPIIYTAAEYGLKWSKYVKELAESNIEEVDYGHDGLTGLRLFMLAALGGSCCDLNSIYGLMKLSPEIL